MDLNCGCPIDQMTRRGLGSSLLQKPGRLARLVAAMAAAVQVPVTVKLRLGWREGKENVAELARACEEAGAKAIAIHGRTREQRYSRAADWDAIGRVAAERGVPVIGNGDILTHYEARARWEQSGVSSVMLARGALIKPWLFREIREGREWLPTAEERFGLLWRFAELLREHFGPTNGDARASCGSCPGTSGFFCRYRPFPEAQYAQEAREHPCCRPAVPIWKRFRRSKACSATRGPRCTRPWPARSRRPPPARRRSNRRCVSRRGSVRRGKRAPATASRMPRCRAEHPLKAKRRPPPAHDADELGHWNHRAAICSRVRMGDRWSG